MPWCPRCDEVFPDGRACPRCRARLEPSAGGPPGMHPVEGLPQLKVPRRYRRAFERLSEPKPPSQRVLAVAVAALLFALGFLLGRVGSTPSQPAVHALPPVPGLAALDASGNATYLVWSSGADRLATIAAHDLYSGEVMPLARFSAPSAGREERTHLAALDGSVALVLAGEDASFVAAAPRHGAPFAWISGVEAAWESRDALLVRSADGAVMRWSTGRRTVEAIEGTWDRLIQIPSGAALVSDDQVVLRSPHGARQTIWLPDHPHVLAVSPDGQRAIVSKGALFLWDGASSISLRAEGYEALGASFTPSGDAAAVTLRGADDRLVVGIVDLAGHVALKPLGTKAAGGGCAAVPAWDASGKLVYVASGDGALHVVESAGGRVETVGARLVGCGLGWFR